MKFFRILSDLFDARKVPSHISGRFRSIDTSAYDAIRDLLIEKYFAQSPHNYLKTPQGQKDLSDHTVGRLTKNRSFVIPWLDGVKQLEGSRVLEIGCGTASSTVALAEQGALVTAMDISPDSLTIGVERCRIYDLSADFVNANATAMHGMFAGKRFDFIMFYASLEHMTYEERLESIKSAWEILPSGGLLCVIETPNRLWYFDSHTSLLPFYHWLPDNLAFDYSRFSPRENFRNQYRALSDETFEHFLRRGRGVSFHEFELALGSIEKLDIEESLSCHVRKRNPLRWLKWRTSFQRKYEALLRRIYPVLHTAFCEPSLNLIVRKSTK